jgi:Tfp pilus assembly protein PilF
VRAELAAFHLRRDDGDDAEKVAKQALALDDANSEAHRVLGLLYASKSEDTARGQAAQPWISSARRSRTSSASPTISRA